MPGSKKPRNNGRKIPQSAMTIIQSEPGKAGRESKLTPELIDSICDDLRMGLTDKMACERNDLDESTFYKWLRAGKAIEAGTVSRDVPRTDETKELITQFVQQVTRARADSLAGAVAVFRGGFYANQTIEETDESFSETRFRKNPETGKDEPYLYQRTTKRTKVIHTPGDWRAGMEWLQRRDKQHFANRQEIQIVDVEAEAARRVVAGELGYKEFMEFFADPDMARRVWAMAGIAIPDEAG